MTARKRIRLGNLPVGSLFEFKGCVALKSEYRTDGKSDAYIVGSGEYFWGGTDNTEDREKLLVTEINADELLRIINDSREIQREKAEVILGRMLLKKKGMFLFYINNTPGFMGAITDAMLEFADQSKDVSDEDIEKVFPITSSHQMDTDSWNNRLRQEGAKWMRSKLAPVK